MKIYKIYLKRNKQGAFEDVILIKEGFIFWAFLLNILWLFYKKIWKKGFVILGILTLLNISQISNRLNLLAIFLIQLGISLYIGFEAGDWHESSLKKKGFEFVGHSSGKNPDEARLRFLENINKDNQSKLKVKVF